MRIEQGDIVGPLDQSSIKMISYNYNKCWSRKKGQFFISGAYIHSFYIDGMKNERVYDARYEEIQKLKGFWYQISPVERLTGDYRYGFFDIQIRNTEPKIVFLNECFKKEIISTIKELYHMSPQKVVYFVIDLQGYKEKKKIISVEDFMELNRREQLFFNTIYKIVLLITQK